MQWDTPELVFIGTALAVGGACLGWLKKRYRNTHHHLLIFCLVGAVGYLAPMHMERAAARAQEVTKLSWLGLTRAYAQDFERDGRMPQEWDTDSIRRVMLKSGSRVSQSVTEVRSVSVVYEAGGQFHQKTCCRPGAGFKLSSGHDDKIKNALAGRESWCEMSGARNDAKAVFGIIPARNSDGAVTSAVVLEFSVKAWNQVRTMAQWQIAGEFTGLLITFVCMGLLLVARAEQRRQRAVEEATKPLLEELESLDGMVNSLHGVVWEREAGARDFGYISEQAAGFLGYPLERWTGEDGFYDSIILPGDRQRVLRTRKEAEKNRSRYELEYKVMTGDGREAYVSEHAKAAKLPFDGVVVRGILVDITRRREAEQVNNEMHKMMLEASRQAGMAEVATGVLHNVGNVLNSLNVAAKLLSERLQKSRFDKLCQATEMLKEHLPDDPEFFVKDSRGQALPGYLADLSTYLREEQGRLSETTSDMIERIEHIRDMIMLQQMHSAVRPLLESLDLATVMDEAVRLEMSVYGTHQDIRIERQYVDIPPVYLPRSLLLQILVNLVANACQAMAKTPPDERLLTLRVVPLAEDRVRICVEDNGCGIDSRHLTKIFKQGYTTKSDGHGFGLHHASLLAADMGGELKAESDGPGKGARFMLDLPAAKDPGYGPHATLPGGALKESLQQTP